MSKIFNIENCDVTMENGYLRLIYHTDELLKPMTLAIGKTYHDLNEKGMYLFGQEDWVENVVEWSIRKESPIWHNLLADIYKNHHDLYASIVVTLEDDEYDEDDEDDDNVLGYLTLEATGDIDEETGYRIAHFERADLAALETGILYALADSCDIADYEVMSREELIDVLSKVDIDIDDCDYNCDGCDCAEKTPAGNIICRCDADEDEGDGEFEVDENAESEQDDAQPEAPQYEYVNGPTHYNGTECIENMRKLYGDEAVRWFCICNAYKYRFRNGSKPGVSAKQDDEKAHWYEDYAAKMMNEQRYY